MTELTYGCHCLFREFPRQNFIPSGLEFLPRNRTGFATTRQSLLQILGEHGYLEYWRPAEQHDIGMMLIEIWAYLAEVLGTYDRMVAQESYLRTAQLRPSTRKLVGLIGYLPRPARVSEAVLYLQGEPGKTIQVPPLSMFQSEALPDQPPQVLVSTAPMTVYGDLNKMPAVLPRIWVIGGLTQGIRLPQTAAGIAAEDLFGVIRVQRQLSGNDLIDVYLTTVRSVKRESGTYQVQLNNTPPLPQNTPVAEVSTVTAALSLPLWSSPVAATQQYIFDNVPTAWPVGGSVPSSTSTSSVFLLDGAVSQPQAGQIIVLGKGQDFRWFQVVQAQTVNFPMSGEGEFISWGTYQTKLKDIAKETRDESTEVFTLTPTIKTLTVVKLDASVNNQQRRMSGYTETWTGAMADQIRMYYGIRDLGSPLGVALPLRVPDSGVQVVPKQPIADNVLASLQRFFAFESPLPHVALVRGGMYRHEDNYFLQAKVAEGGTLSEFPEAAYASPNVLTVEQGEPVFGEILGSGDPTISNQRFLLAKMPLSYRQAASDSTPSGYANTLEVRVEGVLWSEVPTFFTSGPRDQVYIVRQLDSGDSEVIFGDGRYGARVPRGTSNVLANYRFGAGALNLPAGSIRQMRKPVKGISQVTNPLPGAPGAPAETAAEMKTSAPASVMVLGRIVSIPDIEAFVRSVPGVETSAVDTLWDEVLMRQTVRVWYVGEPLVGQRILQQVTPRTDPTLQITSQQATGLPISFSVEIDTDPLLDGETIHQQVLHALWDPASGLLRPRQLGTGQSFFLSRVYQTLHNVPGVTAVRELVLGFGGLVNTPLLTAQQRALAWQYLFRYNRQLLSGVPATVAQALTTSIAVPQNILQQYGGSNLLPPVTLRQNGFRVGPGQYPDFAAGTISVNGKRVV